MFIKNLIVFYGVYLLVNYKPRVRFCLGGFYVSIFTNKDTIAEQKNNFKYDNTFTIFILMYFSLS